MVEGSRLGQTQPAPTEPSGPIADLATRDLDARNKTTGELATEFQTVIERPGAFSWIGVYRRRKPYMDVPTLDVYLAEKVNKSPVEEVQVADAVDAFDDLVLSLRPSLDAHLHLMAEEVIPALRQELEGGQSDQTHQLVFEEQIPQAA